MLNICGKNSIFLITIFGATLALAASPVEACSVCVLAMVDRVLSPVLWWCLTAIVWFLTTAAIGFQVLYESTRDLSTLSQT